MPDITIAEAKEKLRELREEGEDLLENHDDQQFKKWKRSVKAAAANIFGEDSRALEELEDVRFTPLMFTTGPAGDRAFTRARRSGTERFIAYLESMEDELDTYYHEEPEEESSLGDASAETPEEQPPVFVVHGHDHGAKEAVARFLSDLELDPIILHEQANEGRSLLRKFEQEASPASYAVVLLTPDDFGGPRGADEQQPRARQNVIFELGFFVGAMGSEHVCALVDESVELPSDYSGIGYVRFEQGEDRWRMGLINELKGAGLEVDANKAFE